MVLKIAESLYYYSFLLVVHRRLSVCNEVPPQRSFEDGRNASSDMTLTPPPTLYVNVEDVILIQSRFSFNITHREVWDSNNAAHFYWMKTLSKGIYMETKAIAENFESKSNFYKIHRNNSFKWKLRNVTSTLPEHKIQRIKETSAQHFADERPEENDYKLRILPQNIYRIIKTHPKNRNRIKIIPAEFPEDPKVIDFVFVDSVEEILLFCALHDSVNSSLYQSFKSARDADGNGFRFSLSLRNILCINPKKNFPDTWLSSSLSDSLIDVHKSTSSRGVLLASVLKEPLTLEEARMLHVDHLRSVISYDYGNTWSSLHLQNDCSLGESEPSLYLDLAFSRFFFDKPFVGVTENSDVPGFMISTGHLTYSEDTETYPGVFLSRDGGVTWTKIFDERFLVAVSKGGDLMIGVRQCLSGVTRQVFVSYDYGRRWKTYTLFNQDVCIHRIVTNPFNVFVILSSKPNKQMWIVSVIDFGKSISSLKICERKDVHLWPTRTGRKFCVHGHKILNYRKNWRIHCKTLKYSPRHYRYNCSCMRKDFYCNRSACVNENNMDYLIGNLTSLKQKDNDSKLTNITNSFGYFKMIQNSCELTKRSFSQNSEPQAKCHRKTKKSSNIETRSSSATELLSKFKIYFLLPFHFLFSAVVNL